MHKSFAGLTIVLIKIYVKLYLNLDYPRAVLSVFDSVKTMHFFLCLYSSSVMNKLRAGLPGFDPR
jgi:hypothetical protein